MASVQKPSTLSFISTWRRSTAKSGEKWSDRTYGYWTFTIRTDQHLSFTAWQNLTCGNIGRIFFMQSKIVGGRINMLTCDIMQPTDYYMGQQNIWTWTAIYCNEPWPQSTLASSMQLRCKNRTITIVDALMQCRHLEKPCGSCNWRHFLSKFFIFYFKEGHLSDFFFFFNLPRQEAGCIKKVIKGRYSSFRTKKPNNGL